MKLTWLFAVLLALPIASAVITEGSVNTTNVTASNICLSGDCRTAWPVGGSGSTSVSVTNADAYNNFTSNGTTITARTNVSAFDDRYINEGTGVIGTVQLASTNVTAGAYGGANQTLQITFDEDGRATSAISTAIAIVRSAISDLASLAGFGLQYSNGVLSIDMSALQGLNQTAEVLSLSNRIDLINSTKLNITDQRFNETEEYIAADSSLTTAYQSADTQLTNRINSLNETKLNITDQRFNETEEYIAADSSLTTAYQSADTALTNRINSVNETKLNITDSRYNETEEYTAADSVVTSAYQSADTQLTNRINSLNETKLNITDQRFNETEEYIAADSTVTSAYQSADTQLTNRINSLNETKLNITDQRFNDTVAINSLSTFAQTKAATGVGSTECSPTSGRMFNVTVTLTNGSVAVSSQCGADASGSGGFTSIGLAVFGSVAVTSQSPLTGNGNLNITFQNASGSQDGLLRSVDWTTFNNKADAQIIANFTGNQSLFNTSITNLQSQIIYKGSSNVTISGVAGQPLFFQSTTSATSKLINITDLNATNAPTGGQIPSYASNGQITWVNDATGAAAGFGNMSVNRVSGNLANPFTLYNNTLKNYTVGAGLSLVLVQNADSSINITYANTGDTDASNDLTTATSWSGGLAGTGSSPTLSTAAVRAAINNSGTYNITVPYANITGSPIDATYNFSNNIRIGSHRFYTSSTGNAYISASPSFAPRMYLNGGGEAIELDNYQYLILANAVNELRVTNAAVISGVNITNTGGGPGNLYVQNNTVSQRFCIDVNCVNSLSVRNTTTSDLADSSGAATFVASQISNLTLQLQANSRYNIECFFLQNAAAATTGVQMRFNTTGTPTSVRYVMEYFNAAGTKALCSGTSASTNTCAAIASAGADAPALYNAVVVTSASASVFTVEAATEIDLSAATIRAGSWCEARKVN